jgi:hypothetical protein
MLLSHTFPTSKKSNQFPHVTKTRAQSCHSAEWLKQDIESSTKRSVNLVPIDLEKPGAPAKAIKAHIDKVNGYNPR